MLVNFANLWRKRAAAILVVLYALCLLAPTVAFAFSDASAHCLTVAETPQVMDKHQGHQHDGMDHAGMMQDSVADHGMPVSDSNDHALPGQCCGLFCVSAIAPPVFADAEMQLVEATAVPTQGAENLFGRRSSRLDRPPRVLPFV